MKFTAICVIVCAIALNLSINCSYLPAPNVLNRFQQKFNPATWKNNFHKEFNALVDRINATWQKCNQTFGENIHRCLADCTLRLLGVVHNDDKESEMYIEMVDDLRLNNPSFDITKEKCFVPDLDPGPWTVKRLYPDICQIFFSNNADDCADMHDPFGDSCQSSLIVLQCMVNKHREKLPESESPLESIFQDAQKDITVDEDADADDMEP